MDYISKFKAYCNNSLRSVTRDADFSAEVADLRILLQEETRADIVRVYNRLFAAIKRFDDSNVSNLKMKVKFHRIGNVSIRVTNEDKEEYLSFEFAVRVKKSAGTSVSSFRISGFIPAVAEGEKDLNVIDLQVQ